MFSGSHGKGKVSKEKYVSSGQCVWLVKNNDSCGNINIGIGSIIFPKKFIGKRVRLKVEFIGDDEGMVKEVLLKMTKKELRELLKKEYLRGFRSGKKNE